jgi:hypothetical protein
VPRTRYFDGPVLVDFLFDNRIITNDVAKVVAGNGRIGDGDDGPRQDEAGDLLTFGSDPMETIGSGFGCSVGERFTVLVQIEGKRWCGCVGFVGRLERVYVGVGRGG